MEDDLNITSTIREDEIPFTLPGNWKWYKWADLIVDYQQGLIRSNRHLNSSGVPYLKMNNLDNNGSYSLKNVACTNVSEDELVSHKLYEGDFLINVRNSKELVGKTCVIGSLDFDMVFNHMLVRIKHRPGISSIYVNALLSTPVMRKFIDRCKKGTTTVIALYQQDLYEIPIPVPDIETLNVISRFLERISTKLDINNRINSELEAIAKTLYDYWFVQFEFPDQHGKGYRSSGGKMNWSNELKREIPNGWNVRRLEDILLCNYESINRDKQYAFINYLDTGNLTENLIDTFQHINLENGIPPSRAQRVIKKNDILYSTVRPNQHHYGIIKEPIENLIASTGFAQLTSKVEAITNELIYLYLTAESTVNRLQQIAESSVSSYPSISPDDLLDLKITLPNDERILNMIGSILSSLFQNILINHGQNRRLAELRDWLLPMLMNGQVTVGERAFEMA